ncbi:hypothetical protein MUK42_29859 [Musa troglodytarum]|uniref:Uncharacterized protein n=1 Tax=Musa troglodytarum TaxID=320322 RepID=A0A9E7F5I4_9LILI|nr:hypothetical protein MUK42_29859 [Musa troglodytarum]
MAPSLQQQQRRPLSFVSMKPQPCSPAPVSIAELQMHPPFQVSHGLRLTAEEKRRHRRATQSKTLLSSASSVLHVLFLFFSSPLVLERANQEKSLLLSLG